jgi:hypothetical protein
MDAVVKAVIEAIHASPTHAVLYLSGGGSQALGWLLSVPRASGTVLEVTVPYSRASMVQLLGKVRDLSNPCKCHQLEKKRICWRNSSIRLLVSFSVRILKLQRFVLTMSMCSTRVLLLCSSRGDLLFCHSSF